MARWEEALDGQLNLVTSMDTPEMRKYIDGWSAANTRDGVYPTQVDLSSTIRNAALAADPIWVDPDMMTLWEASIPTFQPEPLVAEDLIAPFGFVWLPRPHVARDKHGRRTSIRAYLWFQSEMQGVARRDGIDGKPSEVTQGVGIFLFHSVGDTDDYDLDGNFQWYGPDGSMITRPIPFVRGTLTCDMMYPWQFGKNGWDGRVERRDDTGDNFVSRLAADDEEAQAKFTNVEADLQSLWRLMAQTIAARSQERASNPFRRRWERKKLEPKLVTVVKLRRPHAPPNEDSAVRTVEWSHQWLVSGHWRQQWYPSLSLHRQIWISPYVKGPEDKPLEVRKAHVYELVR